MSIDINGKVNLHNFFTIEVRDAKTNELKQTARAENIVLDQIYSRLVNAQSYFVNIHWGDGLGTPSPSGATLFNHKGTKGATTVETIKSFPVSKWTRSITLGPEEYVNGQITEVGIAFGSANTNLVTHAMLTDSEGNQLTLTKTDVDILTIYATVFIELGTLPEGYYYFEMPNNNSLLNYLLGGGAPSSAIRLYDYYRLIDEAQPTTGMKKFSSVLKKGEKTATVTTDIANKKRSLNTVRFAVSEGNGISKYITAFDSFYANLPNENIFTPTPIQNFALGTGDGITKEFIVDWPVTENDTIKVNGESVNFTKQQISEPPYRKVQDLTGEAQRVATNGDIIITASTIYKYNESTGLYEKVQDLTGAGDGGIAINGDTIVTASTVHKYNESTGLYEKVQDLTGAGGRGVATNGDIIATASFNSAPYFTVHKYNESTGLYEKVQDLTGAGSNGIGIAINGDIIVTASDKVPFFTVHKYNESTGLYEKVQDLTGVGGTQGLGGRGVATNGDIIATASFNSAPFFTVHKYNESTGLYEKVQDLTGVSGNGNGNGIAINGDTIIAVSGGVPYFTVHKYNESTGLYEKVQDLTGASGVGGGVATNGDTIVTASVYAPPTIQFKQVKTKYTLEVPPALDSAVTVNADIPIIRKTTDYVLDISASIQFGSAN